MSEKDALIPLTSSGKAPPGAGTRSSQQTINDSNDKANGTNGSDDGSSTTASGYGSTNRDMAYERVRSSDDDDDDGAPNNSNGNTKNNSSNISRSSEDVRSPNDQRYVNAEEGRGVSKSSNSDSKRLPRVARFGGGGPLAQGYRQVNVATASPSPTSPARALSSDDAHTAEEPGSDGKSPVQTWCEFAARYPKLTVNFDDPDAISFEFAIYTFTIEKEGNESVSNDINSETEQGPHPTNQFRSKTISLITTQQKHPHTSVRPTESDGEVAVVKSMECNRDTPSMNSIHNSCVSTLISSPLSAPPKPAMSSKLLIRALSRDELLAFVPIRPCCSLSELVARGLHTERTSNNTQISSIL
jgi:hypothetical protein